MFKCAIFLFNKIQNKEIMNLFSSDKSNDSDVKIDNMPTVNYQKIIF